MLGLAQRICSRELNKKPEHLRQQWRASNGNQMIVSPDELIRSPLNLGPHVVVLGAGASRAAFPQGDANARFLPLMNDLVERVGLGSLLSENGIPSEERNFESLYASLCEDPEMASLRSELENRIRQYFSELELPECVTLYDRLLLSLRGKDAVLTFNWDPFLFDAWMRNRDFDPPPIYFLHGNVRVRCCPEHPERWGQFGVCAHCRKPWIPTPLLFPISEKNYDDPFIRMNWQAARQMVQQAFTVTVFGYGAPVSDKSAIDLLHDAYMGISDRKMGHFEVIDIRDPSELRETWAPFVPTHHLHIRGSFSDSWMGRYPRRTCEGIFWPMTKGIPAETYEMPDLTEFAALHDWVSSMRKHEDPHPD